MGYCFTLDGSFYNLNHSAYGKIPVISKVAVGEELITYYDAVESEATKLAAYNRRYEYEDSGLEIPSQFELIPFLKTTLIDAEIEEQAEDMLLQVVFAYA